jgi:hypothetical protein
LRTGSNPSFASSPDAQNVALNSWVTEEINEFY